MQLVTQPEDDDGNFRYLQHVGLLSAVINISIEIPGVENSFTVAQVSKSKTDKMCLSSKNEREKNKIVDKVQTQIMQLTHNDWVSEQRKTNPSSMFFFTFLLSSPLFSLTFSPDHPLKPIYNCRGGLVV